VRTLPPKMVQALIPFAPLFSKRVFKHAQLLLAEAILAPGGRAAVPPYARWDWTARRASIATIECLAAPAGRVGWWVASYWVCS
jgi:hypothetical protein